MAYDGRGNLQTYGSIGYATDALNRLTSANGTAMSYDGAGRLYQTTSGGTSTQYLYDGGQIIAEYSGGAVQNRYIPGASLDTPLVWYSGSGTSAANALWLLYDGKGSVAAVGSTGSSNTTVGINTYGPWGEAGPGNTGRFQYKGMPYLASAGLYHDRARDYVPSLGRFTQPDPIGYGDGMNLYAFAHNSPISGADPTGLDYYYNNGNVFTYCTQEPGDVGYTPSTDPIDITGNLSSARDTSSGNCESSLGGFNSAGSGFGGQGGGGRGGRGNPTQQNTPANPCASAGNAPPPSSYADKGQMVNDLESNPDSATGGQIMNAFNLLSFHRGGSMDAQVRYGGSPAYANYAYGVYLQASGASLQDALSLANTYGSFFSHYPAGTPMAGPQYPNIPAANVNNITNGYNAQANGTTCHK